MKQVSLPHGRWIKGKSELLPGPPRLEDGEDSLGVLPGKIFPSDPAFYNKSVYHFAFSATEKNESLSQLEVVVEELLTPFHMSSEF